MRPLLSITRSGSCRTGVTLVEVLLAVVIVAGVVVTVSLCFPKTQMAITSNRQKWLANNFASARMQQLKAQTYDLLPPTPATAGNFPVSGTTANGGCDCGRENFSGLPVDSTQSEDGITYTLKVCINLVENGGGSTWMSHCPDNTRATDQGIKNIRVGVLWMWGNNAYASDLEGLSTR